MGDGACLRFQKQDAKNSCMCNRHDKRVLGGAMMVGSSDLETIFPVCLTCSYFCSGGPWDFMCKGPLGSPHPSESRVIWPGASLGLLQHKWMGRRGLGNCSLQPGACCICREPSRVGQCEQSHPFLARGGWYFKSSEDCNRQWRAQSPVDARATSCRSEVMFQALRVVDSAQPRPEKSMGLSSAALGKARRRLGAGLGGTR